MIIGVPKEIKVLEKRVAITPAGVLSFVRSGHHVKIETNAGIGSGFTDDAFIAAGAEIVPTAADAWDAHMVMKVKEPIESEFQYFKENLILFTYLHLAAEPDLTMHYLTRK